jgi:hypothetical protein
VVQVLTCRLKPAPQIFFELSMPVPAGFKIISGGQSGADRAALDAALEMNIPCGGWCPQDRSAEDGPINPKYQLTPAPGAGNRERTRLNVRDSDGTVIFSFGQLRGGSLDTLQDCRELSKPHLLIDASQISAQNAAESLRRFVGDHAIVILNVAGPRTSEEAGIYDYVRRALAYFAGASTAP